MLNVINDKFKLANSKKIKKSHKSLKNKAVVERDLARGEMVAVLGDKGHNGGSLSVVRKSLSPSFILEKKLTNFSNIFSFRIFIQYYL